MIKHIIRPIEYRCLTLLMLVLGGVIFGSMLHAEPQANVPKIEYSLN